MYRLVVCDHGEYIACFHETDADFTVFRSEKDHPDGYDIAVFHVSRGSYVPLLMV